MLHLVRWLAVLGLCSHPIAQEPAAASVASGPAALDNGALRATVGKAIAWIARQSVAVEDHADCVVFPGIAEQRQQTTAPIYGGTAGVLLFLENAAKVLGDERARSLADQTAAGLLAIARTDEHGLTWAPPRQREGAAALYVGDAGIGAAFLARARLRGDDKALQTATAIGTALLGRGERDGDELHWDKQVEVIYGAAGTALFLLDLAQSVDAATATRLRAAALAVGRFLIAESEVQETAPPRRLWRWQLAGNQPYVGFSHGTAGVGYALLSIGNACGDSACTQAGVDAGEWLLALAVRDGARLRWPVLPGSKTSMGGWCHGPPGTARTFLLLHSLTGEQRHLDVALASARWVMAQAGPADAAIPPAFPPSLCCGVAGAIDFFCDLHRATGDPEFAAFARRAADYLIARAVTDGDGVKWPNGSNAHGGDVASHAVDLMLGASGEALALLRVLTLDQEVDPIVHLPDRRVAAPRPALRRTCAAILTNAPGIFGAASAFRSAKRAGHSVVVAERHYVDVLRNLPMSATTIEAAAGIEELADKILQAAGGLLSIDRSVEVQGARG